MANGSAALSLVFEPESQDAPAGATASNPAARPAATEVEIAAGQAMARAATGLCFAMQEYQNGGLRPETRLANGERIARLFELQEATLGEIDFSLVAREQGRIALRRYLDANDFYCHHSAEQGDAVLEMCIDDVLAVVAKVTAFERAMAN